MKEIKVTIKLTVYSDDRDKELLDEAVYEELQAQMEEQELNYNYKASELDEEEAEDDEDFEEDFE